MQKKKGPIHKESSLLMLIFLLLLATIDGEHQDNHCSSLVPLKLSKWSFPASLVPPDTSQAVHLVLFGSLVPSRLSKQSFPASLVPPRLSNRSFPFLVSGRLSN